MVMKSEERRVKNGGSEERRTKNVASECPQLTSLFSLHFSLFTLHFSPHTQAHSLGYTFHSSLFIIHFSLFTFHYSLFTTYPSSFAWLHSSLFTQNALPSLSFSSYSFPLAAAGGWHMDGEYPLALLCLSLLAGGQ